MFSSSVHCEGLEIYLAPRSPNKRNQSSLQKWLNLGWEVKCNRNAEKMQEPGSSSSDRNQRSALKMVVCEKGHSCQLERTPDSQGLNSWKNQINNDSVRF